MKRQLQRGFTLVEMMVVVAIVAILAGLMIGMSSPSYGVNAENLSNQLVGTLNYARTRALSTRKIHQVQIRLDLSPQELWIYQAPTVGMATTNLSGTLASVSKIVLPKNTKLLTAVQGAQASGASPSASVTPLYVDFFPDGSAAVDGVTPRTGATLYVYENGDSNRAKYRVLIYQATGSSYARQYW